MDEIDKKILIYIQKEFPIDENPYRKIAMDLGLDENIVRKKIIEMFNQGYIKKIIPKFSMDYYKNFERALVALKVKDVKKAAEIINSYENISHNYLRNNEFNVWFTVMAKNYDEIEKQVKEIVNLSKAEDFTILKSKKSLKLNTEFEVDE